MCSAFGTIAHLAYAARLRSPVSSNVRHRISADQRVHRLSNTRTQKIKMTFRFVLAISTALLLASCASVKDASLKIGPGDSKDDVAKAMGAPEDRQFQGTMEAWQYSNIASIGICEYTIVWFRSAKVNGITTYRNSSVSGCRVGMRSIRWEEAPDTVVEIRQR